jgi:hypothetical protein
MEKNMLFLLKADFIDDAQPGTHFVCPECVFLEGLLSYYPRLRKSLEIVYVDFKRPRHEIVKLIGEANQSCPVLILNGPAPEEINDEIPVQSVGNFSFITGQEDITWYLTKEYKLGQLH